MFLASSGFHFHRNGIPGESMEIIENALGQLLARLGAVQALFGQLGREHFKEIQPGRMLGCEDEVEPVGHSCQICARFPGGVGRVVVQDRLNLHIGGILGAYLGGMLRMRHSHGGDVRCR